MQTEKMASEYTILAVFVVIGAAAGTAAWAGYDATTHTGYVVSDTTDNTAIQYRLPGALYASDITIGGSPTYGDQNAAVTMVEWGDYQCTYCHLFHNQTLNQIKTAYVDTGEVKIIFMDFALNGPDSVLAAAAAHCAGDQSRYWEYHDILYQNWGGERTGWITTDALDGFATSAGLDAKEFESCMNASTHTDRVDEMYRAGQAIGIDATPSFLIFNDTHAIKIRGNQQAAVFVDAIERLMPSPPA